MVEADLPELIVGGGLGVAYVAGEEAPTISRVGRRDRAGRAGTPGSGPSVAAEPGRAIAAAAAVTLYTVGTVKFIPGVRTYVAVDGGMSDNPRPVLYGSGYETFLPRAASSRREMPIRLVGKHCESGDLLVREGLVPADLAVGDVIATPVTGAYGHSMGVQLQQGDPPCGAVRGRRLGPSGGAPGDRRRPPGDRRRLSGTRFVAAGVPR